MLKLYHFENSVCAQKVRMTLFEKGVEWESHEVNLFVNAQYDPEYLKLNPKAYVPTLIHDGYAMRESTLICEYLDETYPEPSLSPVHPAERRRCGYGVRRLMKGCSRVSWFSLSRRCSVTG